MFVCNLSRWVTYWQTRIYTGLMLPLTMSNNDAFNKHTNDNTIDSVTRSIFCWMSTGYCNLSFKQERVFITTSGSRGGGAPGANPPNGAPSLRSRFILSLILIEIRSKHAETWLLIQPSKFSMIFYLPPPVDK